MRVYACSDVGKVRPINEDSYYLPQPGERFCAVADGMGGHNAGEIASALAISTFSEFMRGARRLGSAAIHEAVLRANQAVYLESMRDDRKSGMGTTFTGLCSDKKALYIAHVGDSRAYRLRGGELKQITQDHSIVAELLRNNVITAEMARNHPYRNVITRAVGVDPVVTPDVIDEDKQPDDVWLVCSDGLYNMVSDDVIRDTLAGSETDEQAADSLLSLALENGGSDNITFVICRVTEVDGQ